MKALENFSFFFFSAKINMLPYVGCNTVPVWQYKAKLDSW